MQDSMIELNPPQRLDAPVFRALQTECGLYDYTYI